MGEAVVVCGVKAEIAEPQLDTRTRVSAPRFKPGPTSDEAQVFSERLNEAVHVAAPLDELVMHPGKALWTIFVDATM